MTYADAMLAAQQNPPALDVAYSILKKSADGGDVRAIYALATWHLFGNDVVERNEAHGVALLQSISDSNVAEAMFDLAVSYDYGKVVEADEKIAFAYYMKAALLGDSQSCHKISEFYREGKSVDQNDDLSSAWALRANQPEELISPPYRVWLRE